MAAEEKETTQTMDNNLYTCPMHPEVVSDKQGRCPKCGMKLEPKKKKTVMNNYIHTGHLSVSKRLAGAK